MLDAIVVGSGFGGAVTACRLAQAGLRVLILERGRRYEAGDFPAPPPDSALLPDLTRWTWGTSRGLFEILDLEGLIAVQAAAYGGGSLIYANVHLRPPDGVFDEHWPAAYRGGATLQPFFDLAAAMLDAAPIDQHAALYRQIVKADQMRKVATHLGRSEAFFLPPLAINTTKQVNRHGRAQNACTGCGACCSGCPETAKNTLDLNYLAIAEDRGARVITQCEVTRIRQLEDAAGWQVDCTDHITGQRRQFAAPNLFLCAGAVHSVRLLAGARLCRSARDVKRRVGAGYFPGGDALGMVYDTAHPQHPSLGPVITTSMVCWTPGAQSSFFLLQEGGYPSALARLMGTLRAPALVGRNRLTRAGSAAIAAGPAVRPVRSGALPGAASLALVSPLDDVLAALRGGGLDDAVSSATRAGWSALLDELVQPLLVPAIVERTIDGALREALARRWLTRRLAPGGRLHATVMRLAKRAIASALGEPAALAGHAVRAAASAGGRSAAEIASQVLGYTADGADHRIMLLAMGRDAVPGRLRYDHLRNRMIAELALDELAPAYSRSERVMADVAGALGGELRTSPAWALLGKAFSTHNQGGCRMSDEPGGGVTTPDGKVHGCDGLYVADGSLLCTSVGVNPSATIAAVAERNALQFIRAFKDNPRWPAGETDAGAREYAAQQREAAGWALRATTLGWSVRPPETTLAAMPTATAEPAEVAANHQPLGLAFRETMQGFYQPTDRAPRSEAGFRALETAGRPEFPVRLELEVSAADLDRLRHDERRRLAVTGSVAIRLPAEPVARSRTVHGTLELLVRPDGDRDGAERRMNYELAFTDEDARAWTLCGYKRIRAQPWRDTSSLFVTLASPPEIRGAGVVHVDLDGLLFRQVPSLTVTAGAGDPERSDPTRALWAKLEFAGSFLGRLLGSYAPELSSSLATLLELHGGRDHRRRPGRHGRP